ncbi:hypothetical protein IKM_03285 [Bacillus mycoides]|nr:hypothetical protein IKM_03285 [Bacillus mycoides]
MSIKLRKRELIYYCGGERMFDKLKRLFKKDKEND